MADKKIQLLIYKMKDGCKEDSFFIKDHKMDECEAEWPDGIKVYMKKSSSKTPVWLNDFFGEYLSKDKKNNFQSSTVSCVVVVHIRKEDDSMKDLYFCACFGHGYQYVNKEFVEHDFGINLSRKILNSNRVKSIDIRSFEAIPKRKSLQAFKDSTFSGYLLDAAKDNIQQVIGRSKSDKDVLNDRVVGGTDAFKILTNVDIKDIGSFLQYINGIYINEEMKDRLGYVSMYKEISIADVLGDIVESIKLYNKLYLSLPSSIDSFDDIIIEYLNFSELEGKKFSALEMSDIKGSVTSIEILQKAKVKFTMLTIEGENDEETQKVKEVSVIECLTGDFFVSSKNKSLTILDNKVYELSGEFSKYVDSAYCNTELNEDLPTVSDYGNEDDYNRRVCEAGEFLRLDKVLHTVEVHENVELCDFMGPDKKLYCVKRKHDSSALGHLFDQAVASASALLLDRIEEFNDKIKQHCDKDKKKFDSYKLERINPSDYTYVFVILDDENKNEKKRPEIPFMAKISYFECYRRLKSFGFNIQVCGVNCKYSAERAAELKNEAAERKAKVAAEKEKKAAEKEKKADKKKVPKAGSGAEIVEEIK